jgi:tRNA pseudouridine38-40 synthase
MTHRWKLTIEYDGTPFAGWQRQATDPSVQGTVEAAIKAFSGEEVTLHVAGRTDAGVHAMGQVAHVDLEKDWPEKTVRDAINAHLRQVNGRSWPVSIVTAEAVGEDFHARYGAKKRIYRYKIIAARVAEPVLARDRVWHVTKELDVAAMQAAAQPFLGQHDFTSFRAAACQAKSPVRTLERLDVIAVPNGLETGQSIEVWAEARSFLHHQIRNITGALKMAGEGKWTPDDVKRVLEARDRTQNEAAMAPACGLYFLRVDYT